MRKPRLAAAAIFLLAAGAQAGTASDDFNVTINFFAGCSVAKASKDFSFTYTAFDPLAQQDADNTIFKCTRGLVPTFSFDNPNADQTGASGVGVNGAVTAEGVIKGVRYTIDGATSNSVTGAQAVAGPNGTPGSNGSADEYNVALTVTVPADQAGQGADGSGTHTRTLTISF